MGFKPLTIMQKMTSKMLGLKQPEKPLTKKQAAKKAAKTGGTTPGVVGKK